MLKLFKIQMHTYAGAWKFHKLIAENDTLHIHVQNEETYKCYGSFCKKEHPRAQPRNNVLT